MNRIKIFTIFIIILTLFSCNTKSQVKNPIVSKNPSEYSGMKFPKPIGYINDFSRIFNKDQVNQLEEIIDNFEKKTSNEIVIVTMDSIKPYDDIHLYSTDIGHHWGVGKKGKNNGLVIVLCKNLRNISISTGYGTEKILTDRICKIAIDSTMIPEFKKGEFYVGMKKGLEELITKWN